MGTGFYVDENIIITNNSNPREMTVVEDMIYFTNWDTQDLKIFNTNTNQIEEICITDVVLSDSDGIALNIDLIGDCIEY